MADSFDDIFNNIQLSEQESKAQQDYLELLKSQIANATNEVKEVESKHSFLKENFSKRIKLLANREVDLLTLDIRQKTLEQRNDELKKDNEELKKTMADLKTRLRLSRETLCRSSRQFIDEVSIFSVKPSHKEFSYKPQTEMDKTVREISVEQKECSSFDGDELWEFDIDFNQELSK